MKSTNQVIKSIQALIAGKGWAIRAASIRLGEGNFSTVLIEREFAAKGREWSTHKYCNGQLFWGHYDMSEADARADYAERAKSL